MDIIVNGARLHYIEAGNGAPVLCIHGLGLNLETWRHLFPQLRQHYRTIAYDLRGMGKSEAPGRRGVTHTLDLHADDLEALMDALKIEKGTIIAHAFGAFISMRFAMKRPERVKAVVIFSTSAMLGEPGISQALYRAAVAELDGMSPLLEGAMSRWFTKSFRLKHPEVIQFFREMLGSTPPLGYAASARAIAQMDLRPDLEKIRCPTLVVGGKEDWSTPPEGHEVIAKGIPGARLVIVQNASHTITEEQAEEFNRLTLEFLDQNIRIS